MTREGEIVTQSVSLGAPIIEVRGLTKTYTGGPKGKRPKGGVPAGGDAAPGEFQALKGVDLDIRKGEIFALLGPNGAGKTTLINIICGIVTPTAGTVTVGGYDHRKQYRAARNMIGLVPQELHTDAFESVWATTSFSRGVFGKRPAPAHIEKVLRDLSLWDKKDARIMMLSGGMKRRVMIAKALAHEPQILFLDEPTAGVDVELRRDMWAMVHQLRESGVTIILTTHYIEEAEQMADRIGVISKGELILVEEKSALIEKLGKKELRLTLQESLSAVPETLAEWNLALSADGYSLTYSFDSQAERTGVPSLMRRMADINLAFSDIETRQSSLEEIFVSLVHDDSRPQGMRQ
jgi:ABC-2 type transport system ATP-binding protein